MRSKRFGVGSLALALPLLLPFVAAQTACGGAKTSAKVGPKAASASADAAGPIDFVTPAFLLPDLVGEAGVVQREDGLRLVLVDRMRLVAREDGSLERARELLPAGPVRSFKMPPRLGGGYVFHVRNSGNTQLFRASNWLDRLEPLAEIRAATDAVIPGFDRLYLRVADTNAVRAIDPRTGHAVSLGSLPPAAAYGSLAFADGWRAVVDVDLRGPLATFDAGATWRPLRLGERVTNVSVVKNDPVVNVNGGAYTIDARGNVTFRSNKAREETQPADEPEANVKPVGPLGKRPLRAAVEDGWPDTPTTAIVARGGAFARVSLRDGSVKALVEEAYPERQSSCHAVRLGKGVGFICGERDGATAIYQYSAPLAMKAVMRFAKPRFVSASGNGALVIRGSCGDEVEPASESRPYCIRHVSGKTREVRVKGDVGVERVVALRDDRVAVLVPPRGSSSGQLTLLSGASATSVALKLPGEQKSAVREARRGMWLEGFEERDKDQIAGWVEAGGPLVGVRVALDGQVTVGEQREDATGAIVSGRFGFSLGEGRAAETTDGGMTWKPIELPERDEAPNRTLPTRACGPAGCALGAWVRVGWGKPASPDDLLTAKAGKAQDVPLRAPVTLPLVCELEGNVTPPLPETKAKSSAAAAQPPRPHASGPHGRIAIARPAPSLMLTSWLPFRNTAPPAIGSDETGVDNGTLAEPGFRAYAWGKRGADWTRAGRWMFRFDDRFDRLGGLRSSAVSAAPFADENAVGEAIGTGSYNATMWATANDRGGTFLDPSGRALLAAGCRSVSCAMYAVTDGQPVLPLRDPSGRAGIFYRPTTAVRVGETWLFMVSPPSSLETLTLYRADLGVARPVTNYYRPSFARSYGASHPVLVRRDRSNVVGILLSTPPEPGEKVGTWFVMPLNPENGELGEAIVLRRKDFGGQPLTRCAPGQDGWIVDVKSEVTIPIDFVGGTASHDTIEMRLKLDAGSACVEGLATRFEGPFGKGKAPHPATSKAPPAPPPAAKKPVKVEEATAIPLSATERGTGRRWSFRCGSRK